MSFTGGNGNGLLTSKEIAEHIRVTAATVQRWTRKREIPYYTTPGGQYRYDRDEVDAWLESRHGSSEQGDDE